MIECRECGATNDDVATFCRKCRKYIGWYDEGDVDTAPRSIPVGEPATSDAASVLFVGLPSGSQQRARNEDAPPAVNLWVQPDSIRVEPGEEATLEFRVHNAGSVVDRVTISAEGEGAAWAKVVPASVNLYPGDTATGTISLHPPRDPNVPAGQTRLVVRARSGENPDVAVKSAVAVTVQRFHEMSAELIPREVTGRRARHVLTLRNAGNAPLEPAIRVVDENNVLVSVVDPGFAALRPGRAQKVDVRVRPKRRNWIGDDKRFRYRVVAEEKDAPPVERDAGLTQRPFVPGWLARLALIAIPLVAALVAFLMLWTTVPEVDGLGEAEATERLEEAGLEAGVVRQHSARFDAGKVMKSEPGAGERIREGSKVELFVSSGPRPVPIPNVVGLDAATARHELNGMGLAIEEVAEESEKVEPGLVVATRPAANLLVPPGSEVQMIVSEAPRGEKGAGGSEKGEDEGEEDGEKSSQDGEDEDGKGDEDDPDKPYWTSSVASSDFDGDGSADLAVFRPGTAAWHVRSGPGETRSVDWTRQRGTDIPVPGDYDGDGKADFATWRPADATWYVRKAGSKSHDIAELGKPGDIPVPADYDGDGRADRAAFGAEDGRWRIQPSSGDDSAVHDGEWGDRALGDLPVPGDYDGDGKADPAVYRATSGRWKVSFSGGGKVAVRWGDPLSGDIPVPGDYTGDGRHDFAVWRPQTGEWRVRPSGGGENVFSTWGRRDLLDVPVPGDYTGDGTWDFAVWRESTRAWRIRPAEGTKRRVHYWGRAGDVPL